MNLLCFFGFRCHLILWSYNFLSESICSYSRIVSQLDGLVKAMAFESYGVRKYLDSHINSTAYLLRVIKYSVPKERESDIGAVSHTDKSFISILHQNDVKGLEIKTRDDKWIGFEPLPSSFVVMAGEAFTVSFSHPFLKTWRNRMTVTSVMG